MGRRARRSGRRSLPCDACIVRGQLLSAASDLRAYLPAAMAARLALPVLELAASPHWSHSAPQLAADLADLLNSATTLGSSAEGHACGVDADGPAAGEQAPIEGIPITPARRVAERLAARAEAAVRAPWKAAIAFARAAKRESRGNAGQSGDGAARDLRNDPRDERPGACPRDEAAVVGSPGDSSLRTSWRDPTLVSATQPGAAGWAHWPLQDLRNNPPSKRAGACARGEAAAVGSPGDASLPASPGGPTVVGATRSEAAARANWPRRALRHTPRDEAAGAGSPGDPSLPASPRGPMLVGATRPEAAVRANWPLRDLRNNPLDERPRACPAVPGACPVQQRAAAPGHDSGPGRLAPSLAAVLRSTTPAGTWQPSVRAELDVLFGATARVGRTVAPGRSASPVTPVGATAVFGRDCVQRPFAQAGAGRRTR